MSLSRGLSSNLSSSLTSALTATCDVLPPNSGSVVLNGTDQYLESLVTGMADASQFTILAMVHPDGSQASTIYEASFLFTSGKTSSRRYPVRLTMRGINDGFRVQLSSDVSSTNLRLTSTLVMDLAEDNIIGFSGDIFTQTYYEIHWSETSGMTANLIGAGLGGGELFNFSKATRIAAGANFNTLGQFADFFGGEIAQVYLSNTMNVLTNQDVQDKILLPDEYLNFEGLGIGVASHSGNTSTFPPNSAIGAEYATLTAVNSPTDGAGPTPPFTL